VDLVRFARELRNLTADDIRTISADIGALVCSPAEEVVATKAVLSIEQSVHRMRRSQQAGLAAHAVAQAVLAAAERGGIKLPNDDATRVARSAATIARGIVAGPVVDDAVQFLLGGWCHIVLEPIAA
jgi:hypothetical protein